MNIFRAKDQTNLSGHFNGLRLMGGFERSIRLQEGSDCVEVIVMNALAAARWPPDLNLMSLIRIWVIESVDDNHANLHLNR